MIASLKGVVLEGEEKSIVLEAGGVGYRVMVLSGVRSKARVGTPLSLLIHHHVGENDETLYGFDTKEYLRHFLLLLTVPSIGPRTAMNVLELVTPAALAQAVSEKDTALLTKVSGVGKRTAERIVIELQGKLTAPKRKQVSGAVQQEVVEALVSLGYSNAQAKEAVSKLSPRIDSVEEAVRAVLQQQGKQHLKK
jgi:Holliday junction DNA helicase RuvA